MPEAVPFVSVTPPAAPQTPEPAITQADSAAVAAPVPFPQALAQQLAQVSQIDAQIDTKNSARAAVAGAAHAAPPLPPDGDALPLTLPLELTPAPPVTTAEKNLTHDRTPAPADAAPAQADASQIMPPINIALPAAEVASSAPLPAGGNGTDRAGPEALAYAAVSNAGGNQNYATLASSHAGGNPNDAALTMFSSRVREDVLRSGAGALAAAASDTGTAVTAATTLPASGLLAAVTAPLREPAASVPALPREIKPAQAEGGGDAAAAAPSAFATASPEPRAARTEAPVPMQITLPLQDPNWAQAAGQRVLWMVKNETQSAELRINPPDLGPVEMRVTLNGNDQASVSFASPHAAVRDALEAAFPRLRDMLGANGLTLADVNVSAQTFAEQRQSPDYRGGVYTGQREGSGDLPGEAAQSQAQPVRTGAGLLDLYA